MPDKAGEWEWLPPITMGRHLFTTLLFSEKITALGWNRVAVTETPTGGRMCKELRMGGSAMCGFAPWSGSWRRV